MHILRTWFLPVMLVVTLAVVLHLYPAKAQSNAAANVASSPESQDWPVWNGSPENRHYSSLAQINRSNVKQLEVAWTYDTGEQGGLQTSPLVVDGVLYGITPTQKIFAI